MLSLEWPTENPQFGLCLQREDVEATLGYEDFLEGLEELKALPMKERKLRLKNEVFRVYTTTPLS